MHTARVSTLVYMIYESAAKHTTVSSHVHQYEWNSLLYIYMNPRRRLSTEPCAQHNKKMYYILWHNGCGECDKFCFDFRSRQYFRTRHNNNKMQMHMCVGYLLETGVRVYYVCYYSTVFTADAHSNRSDKLMGNYYLFVQWKPRNAKKRSIVVCVCRPEDDALTCCCTSEIIVHLKHLHYIFFSVAFSSHRWSVKCSCVRCTTETTWRAVNK